MVELRTLHLTDIHDDFEKYQVIAQYIASKKGSEEAVDAVFITGDFIEGHEKEEEKTASKIDKALKALGKSDKAKEDIDAYNHFIKQHGKEGTLDLSDLDEKLKPKFEEILKKINAHQSEAVVSIIEQAYQTHFEEISKLNIPVFAILGNHDLNLGYKILKEVNFVEKTNKISLQGKNGLEFIIKGDLNTLEIPPFYVKIMPIMKEYLIPYQSGHSLSELSKEVNQLQAEVSSGESERLEKIAKKEEPKYSEEKLKEMQANLEYLTELRKVVIAYTQSEIQRLDDKNEADIYLTHKLPSCKKARPDIKGPLSDITLEYAASSNAIYGGHFHDGQVGYKTIENLLKQESTETTTIDGVEVAVYYLDKNEPRELNPGTKHFFVTEYDSEKQIVQVVIHEFCWEEAA